MFSEFWFDSGVENMAGLSETGYRMDNHNCLELEETIKGPVSVLLQHAAHGL